MEFHQRIIDERREILKNNNINNNNNNEKESTADAGYSIFIDHILNNPGRFNDQEIRDHVITVLSAGEFLFLKFQGTPKNDLLQNYLRLKSSPNSSWSYFFGQRLKLFVWLSYSAVLWLFIFVQGLFQDDLLRTQEM